MAGGKGGNSSNGWQAGGKMSEDKPPLALFLFPDWLKNQQINCDWSERCA